MDLAFCRDRLIAIANAVSEGIVIVGKDGKVVFANDAIEKVLGLSPAEILGTSLRDSIWNIVKTPHTPLDGLSLVIELPDKREAVVSLKPAILRDEAGQATGIILLFSDIARVVRNQEALKKAQADLETRVKERTAELLMANALLRHEIAERKQAEVALKQSEEKYRALINYASDAIILTDLAGSIIEVNKRAEELTGYTHDELLNMTVLQIHPADELNRHQAAFKEMVERGLGILHDAFVQRKDGRQVMVDITGSVVEYGGQKVAQGIFRDMSEKQRSKELSDALNKINMAISSTLDFNEIMQRVVKYSAEALGADSASAAMREDDYWVARHFHGLGPDHEGARLSGNEIKYIGQVIRARKPVAIADALNDPRVDANLMRQFGVRSVLAIPLIIRDEVIGVLRFVYTAAPVTFDSAQMDFAAKLAAYITLALENARLYSEERNIADTLQEALLSMPDRLPGIDFGYLYNSATEAAKVGGDFYDMFELEHNQIGILIGDVSGKGLEAATLTSLIKNIVRAYAYGERSPAFVIAKTNETVYKMSDPSIFITVFFAILDVETGRLVYCNGGHPPPILKRKDDPVSLLTSESPVIGAFLNVSFNEATQVLEQGDTLVLYTDGVTEARHGKKFFGETRLHDLVRSLGSLPAKAITEKIFKEVIDFSGGNLFDDLALLVITFGKAA